MWKEFDIETQSLKLKELGVDDAIGGKCFINLSDVVAIYETFSDKDEEMTNVLLRGGETIGVFVHYSKFKAIIETICK